MLTFDSHSDALSSSQLTYIEQFPADFIQRLGDPVANVKKWKIAARNGIPDNQKRKFILSYFKIDPLAAQN